MADEKKIIIEVELDSKQAQKEAERLTGEIAAQREELKAWRKILKDSGGTNKQAAQEVAKLSSQIKQNSKALNQATKEANAEDNSINALRASVSKLTAERNQLNTATTKGKKRFEELTGSILDQTNKLKELEGAVGDTRRNVGNYKADVLEALNANSLFSDTLGKASEGFELVTKSTQSFKVALIALPIFAIVTALQFFFTQTEEGRKLLERFGKIASGVFGKIAQDIAKVGKFIVGLFDGSNSPLELLQMAWDFVADQFINRIQAIGMAFTALANGDIKGVGKAIVQFQTGLDVKKLEAYGDELLRIAKIADTIALSQRKARFQIRALNAEIANQQRLAEENRKLRDDETKSFEERLEANNKVLKAEEARRDFQLKVVALERKEIEQNARQRANAAKERIKNTEEEVNTLLELEARKNDILEDFAGRTTEQLTEQNAIIKDKLKARAELEAAALETRLLRQEVSAEEELKLRLAILRKLEEAEKVGLNSENEDFKLITQQFLNERLQLRKDFAEKLSEVQIEETTKSSELLAEGLSAQNQIILESEEDFTERLKGEFAKREKARKDALTEQQIIAEAEKQTEQVKFDAAKNLTAGLANLVGEQTAIGKSLFLANQAFALADVLVQSNAARVAILAKNAIIPAPAGPALSAAEIASLNINTALSVAGIIGATVQGFAEGGYTGDGGKYQPAGVVHRGEIVIPQTGVKAMGGASQAMGTISSLGGFASGGIVGSRMSAQSRVPNAINSLSNDISRLQVQVAVTDINKASGKYNAIQAKVNS